VGVVAGVERAGDGGGGHLGLDTVVDDVDHSANGGAAVEEGGGTADDFHAFDEQGVEADGVVGAGIGGVDGVCAVLENAHAVGAEAADDGAAGGGAEGGGAEPGGVGEGFAEGGLLILDRKSVV